MKPRHFAGALQISLGFDNLEPFWRVPHATINTTAIPIALSNGGKVSRPRIVLTVGTTIATTGVVTLLTFGDGLSVTWNNARIPLIAGDKLTIDSDALTVTRQVNGAGPQLDAIRAYDYTPPINDGFPVVPKGGGSITAKHANVTTVTVDYDELYK